MPACEDKLRDVCSVCNTLKLWRAACRGAAGRGPMSCVHARVLVPPNRYLHIHTYIIYLLYLVSYIVYYGARARAGGTYLVAVLHAASVIGCWGRAAGAASVLLLYVGSCVGVLWMMFWMRLGASIIRCGGGGHRVPSEG